MHDSDSGTPSTLLAQHRLQMRDCSLAELFAQDSARVHTFSVEAAGLLLDFSKNFCTERTLQLFERQADTFGLRRRIDELFHGMAVNNTELRPALHTSLRSRSPAAPMYAEVQAVLARMRQLTDTLSRGEYRGFTDRPLTDVINIGIGGSDLGPRFAVAALHARCQRALRVHFVANVDPAELSDTLAGLDPATTLIITASKSFATLETLNNSLAARAWLRAAAGDRAIDRQLVAITANPERARAFGVPAENVFPMWDWVGGRYSLWSAIGLPIAIAIGWDNFDALLRGAEAMDTHYRETPVRANMPAILAMLECWYSSHWQAHSVAILPYSHRLRLFPAFLQQLSMESLGKSVDREGAPLSHHSGAVIWGEPGTNCQHSFMQLVHQGTRFIPVDFIAVVRGEQSGDERSTHLFANCIGQSRALLTGKSAPDVLRELIDGGMPEHEARVLTPHKTLPGNRPSNTVVLPTLDPAHLGALIALYEHKVHAQSVIWGINAFDQWGVELGKQSAGQLFAALRGEDQPLLDASTARLIERFRHDIA